MHALQLIAHAAQNLRAAHTSLSRFGRRLTAYEVRTAFPAKAYTDLGETLRSAGLVPNATVFLRALATAAPAGSQ